VGRQVVKPCMLVRSGREVWYGCGLGLVLCRFGGPSSSARSGGTMPGTR
jgi:hypothetical protein